ncbi:hypothetical protein D8674_024209 [Pyrus ussuriensis x Pyrus communis]|uniref:Uncharacterized protein n=1 Tax=Pyrus ussuriensis x Pyrus communis TaxID=2448454 RepID=A0A5N5H4A5_9ROSA|nr:hypothetical protein D8674_024209 [Pyrus ussuriensis x Pyrus communis]
MGELLFGLSTPVVDQARLIGFFSAGLHAPDLLSKMPVHAGLLPFPLPNLQQAYSLHFSELGCFAAVSLWPNKPAALSHVLQ